MNLRMTTLLALSGLAACSNTTNEPAREPDGVGMAASDGEMRPASLDDQRTAVETTEGASAPGTDVERGRDATLTPSGSGMGDSATGSSAPSTPTRAATDGKDASRVNAATPTPAGTPPDNTKVNERDRNAAAQTPIDQGNNETDLKITQQIRQAVMANDSLSFTAKNVKIITNGGRVTLRGPVKTVAERDAIDAAARKVAGTQVDNQIEVKK